MKHKTWLFIFRQDLRIIDNVWFSEACKTCENIIPLFIFDTEVFDRFPKDDKRLGFQWEALEMLEKHIADIGGILYVEYGKSEEVVSRILWENNIDVVHVNRSYGTWSHTRDKKIREHCEESWCDLIEHADYLMLEIDVVETRKVFTPFFKKRLPRVQENYLQWLYEISTPTSITTPITKNPLPVLSDHKDLFSTYSHPTWKIQWIRERLAWLSLTEYDITRNLPANTEGTTKLSPYLAFGVVGPREVYRQFVNHMSVKQWFPQEKNWADIIVSELAWREFWQHVSYWFPETTFEKWLEFQGKRKYVQRENNEERFERWKNGTTWYPIVDAWMRQLKEENWMHNRVRMIVASFLTKDLLIDRRWGEKHFADYLIDYDRNVNVGNRQRSASVWADPKPLRIFNPILQSKRFDPLCEYIYKRVPEVKGQPIPAIHDPIKYVLDYHTPVVDHYVRSKIAKTRYNESKAKFENNQWLI